MSEPAITVEGLSKRYRLGSAAPTHDTFVGATLAVLRAPLDNLRRLARLTRFNDSDRDIVWALKEVSFSVRPGEIMGIVGRNGAGKSTLLKILSRIVEPSSGRATIRGRVASLLEVGTGFHRELSGRENVFLNGAILGMRRREIDSKFEEIVEFSGVSKFIDTPVKFYSSGMHVRLAFAVAAHLEAEILLIDEVLAVGDYGFQKKCLGKMSSASHSGRTVLFVSHNMGAISTLCDRTIVLDQGGVTFSGETQEAVQQYTAEVDQQLTLNKTWGIGDAPSGEVLKLRRVIIGDGRHDAPPYLLTSDPIAISVDYQLCERVPSAHVGIQLVNADGIVLFTSSADGTTAQSGGKPGQYRARCHIPGDLLAAGRHTLHILGMRDAETLDVTAHDVVGFTATDDRPAHSKYTRRHGVVAPRLSWETAALDPPD